MDRFWQGKIGLYYLGKIQLLNYNSYSKISIRKLGSVQV